MGEFTGEAYKMDAAIVHTFIINFIAANDIMEAKVQKLMRHQDSRIY